MWMFQMRSKFLTAEARLLLCYGSFVRAGLIISLIFFLIVWHGEYVTLFLREVVGPRISHREMIAECPVLMPTFLSFASSVLVFGIHGQIFRYAPAFMGSFPRQFCEWYDLIWLICFRNREQLYFPSVVCQTHPVALTCLSKHTLNTLVRQTLGFHLHSSCHIMAMQLPMK